MDKRTQQYYETLELDTSKDHTAKEIKSAWIRLTKVHHPDKGGDVEMFKKITHAYCMLTDPSYAAQEANKEEYDRRDLHVKFQIPITFNEAFFGTVFKINYGFAQLDSKGFKVAKEEVDGVKVYELSAHTVEVVIPPGSFAGGEMSFTDKGVMRIGEGEEAEHGDVNILITVMPHHKFQWDPNQGVIRSNEHIGLDILLKGGSVDVETMNGIKALKIRPGTGPGTQIGIKGAGFQGRDHVVAVHPRFPTKEELKTDAWKGLDIQWEVDEKTEAEEKLAQEMLKAFSGLRFSTSTRPGTF